MRSSASFWTYGTVTASNATGMVGDSRPALAKAASYPSLSPQVALVGDVLDQYRLIQPIVLSFEQADKGKIIASDNTFYMYGEGTTRHEAVLDYLSSLSEYYSLIESLDDAPSVELFSYLQTYLQRK